MALLAFCQMIMPRSVSTFVFPSTVMTNTFTLCLSDTYVRQKVGSCALIFILNIRTTLQLVSTTVSNIPFSEGTLPGIFMSI